MVEGFKLKFTLLQREILEFLFANSGKSFNQRNLASNLGVSSTAIAKSLDKLEREKLITKKKEESTKIISISLNRDNSRVIHLKRADNLKQIYESGLYNYLEENFLGSTIVLFGSYAYGEDTLNSDIDIAIIGYKNKDVDLDKFEKLLNKEIRINFYDNLKKVHKHLKENIYNGIILKGGVEL